MTMNFREIKTSLINVLGTAAAGRYQTIGYQEQGQSAEETKNNNRSVQVYYSQGSFPKSAGGLSGPVMHDITFRLDLTASMKAKGDIATINNPGSTDEQVIAAIAAFQKATNLADQSFDELVDILYQVIMSAENYDLGMDRVVADRWLDQINKDPPNERGGLVIITGSMLLTCSIDEQVTGDAGVLAVPPVQDTEIEPYLEETGEKDPAKAGLRV